MPLQKQDFDNLVTWSNNVTILIKLILLGLIGICILKVFFRPPAQVSCAVKPWCVVVSAYRQDENLADNGKLISGKNLFITNCAQCHAKDMKTKLTGPALSGLTERWMAYPRQDLYNFIRNSQAQIKKKHPKAEELWNTWQPTVMNSFQSLSDEEIEAILAYIGD